MSQVINKFEPGGKTPKPRLYQRGNDTIDRDAYIRKAESEFSYWLANSGLKDKQKQEVQEAFSSLIQGVDQDKLTYKMGGGYRNTLGISNKEKGFDAPGLAAGFLGNILRSMEVYKEPEEIDTSKTTWKGNQSIGSVLTKHLFGNDSGNVQDFMDLDPYDETTKKRGNVNRSARFKSGLEYIRDNFDNLFTSFSDQDKTRALSNIDSALKAFENGSVEDNEYLDLGKATGIQNLRQLFSSQQVHSTTKPGAVTPPVAESTGVTDEAAWRESKYPRTRLTQFAPAYSLKDSRVYYKEGRDTLDNVLKTLPDKALFKIIRLGVFQNTNLNTIKQIKSGFGQETSFNNQFIINRTLEVLRGRGSLHQFDSSSNNYYIPETYISGRGTALVYNTQNGGSIQEADIYNIPFWINKMHQEFMSQVPSNKEGGVLKFQTGGVSNVKYTPNNYSWNDIIYGSNQFATVLQGLNLNNYEAANALQNRFFTDKINSGWNQGRIQKRDEVSRYQTDFDTAYGVNLNQGAIEDAIKAGKIVRAGTTGDNLSGKYSDGYSGAMTNLRHLGTNEHVDKIVEMNKILNQNGLEAFLNEETNMINYRPLQQPNSEENPEPIPDALAARRAVVQSTTQPGAKTEEELFGSDPEKDLGEKHLPITPIGSFQVGKPSWSEFIPDLLGASRLGYSLWTNRKVANTVRPSLVPVLKDTYERYSPVTGAFGEMSLRNRQGAEVLSRAGRPISSDASLAAATMLDANRQANELQTQGFIADNNEIRRTKAEALQRQEDNMARRSEVANFNRASINQTNRERAQLEATRLKSDWQSIDNYLAGVEGRIRTRMDDNRTRYNNFWDTQDATQAEQWMQNKLRAAERDLQAWYKEKDANGVSNINKDPATEWKDYADYMEFTNLVRNMGRSMMNRGMSPRYHLGYKDPYKEDWYTLLDWNKRGMTTAKYGIVTQKRGGQLLPFTPNWIKK